MKTSLGPTTPLPAYIINTPHPLGKIYCIIPCMHRLLKSRSVHISGILRQWTSGLYIKVIHVSSFVKFCIRIIVTYAVFLIIPPCWTLINNMFFLNLAMITAILYLLRSIQCAKQNSMATHSHRFSSYFIVDRRWRFSTPLKIFDSYIKLIIKS